MTESFNRRDFLKLSGFGLAGLLLPPFELEFTNESSAEKLIFSEQKYLADTHAKATKVAEDIDFIKGKNESPSNMCGPLAASIMLDSCFYPKKLTITPKKFWLADPSRLDQLLPVGYFSHIHFSESVRSFDFAELPLKAGDFLFLHGGSFGHMLLVSETDKDQKAYAISNVLQPENQFTIEKILLYDPKEPTQGYFRNEWSNPKSVHGRTGVEFDIWRLKNEFLDPDYFKRKNSKIRF